MGRIAKSQGLAPPAIRKDMRAKQARHIVNKVIPSILASNPRARKGAEESELILDPGPVSNAVEASGKEDTSTGGDDVAYIKRKGQGRRKAKGGKAEDEEVIVRTGHEKGKGKKRNYSLNDSLSHLSLKPTSLHHQNAEVPQRTIRIVATDALTAAHLLHTSRISRKAPNVCILNMASPLRPGGGVLAGASSQEEFLCSRTTLLPSLQESFYRLPEYGGIYSPNVLVFRSSLPLSHAESDLPPSSRYYIDVISAGMLRFPELEGSEGEEKRLSKKDRELVEKKMRAVLRIASSKGVKKIVLGAWGCGAYGNPVRDIAEAWRRVLEGGTAAGGKKSKKMEEETWSTIESVVFAISNAKMAHDFAKMFGGGAEVEPGPGGQNDEDEAQEEDKVVEELRSKIGEMESQLEKVWNSDLKQRMSVIIEGLRAQLREREGAGDDGDEEDDEEDEGEEGNEAESEEETPQVMGKDDADERSDTDEEADRRDDSGGEGSRRGGLKLPLAQVHHIKPKR
ncbi:hypothetical protein BU26DRAFT_244622 [Trematosphaeria pertusa]|uniref:Microbial-type PARG catalytic domain-containing protein n=1 Tax=Trematosphaeria pertusa TaxID=390896 RepID=A0A6A6INI6_9PLEO|nr:uncharacterized protein BU26DRAFT_244622 [Trematosphaeria pertusa]KAF2251797.1 hypothetical protein BU26DRAFT_244622 [Trematosphaeria pertusa]